MADSRRAGVLQSEEAVLPAFPNFWCTMIPPFPGREYRTESTEQAHAGKSGVGFLKSSWDGCGSSVWTLTRSSPVPGHRSSSTYERTGGVPGWRLVNAESNLLAGTMSVHQHADLVSFCVTFLLSTFSNAKDDMCIQSRNHCSARTAI